MSHHAQTALNFQVGLVLDHPLWLIYTVIHLRFGYISVCLNPGP
jgi:hypothetical protein